MSYMGPEEDPEPDDTCYYNWSHMICALALGGVIGAVVGVVVSCSLFLGTK